MLHVLCWARFCLTTIGLTQLLRTIPEISYCVHTEMLLIIPVCMKFQGLFLKYDLYPINSCTKSTHTRYNLQPSSTFSEYRSKPIARTGSWALEHNHKSQAPSLLFVKDYTFRANTSQNFNYSFSLQSTFAHFLLPQKKIKPFSKWPSL